MRDTEPQRRHEERQLNQADTRRRGGIDLRLDHDARDACLTDEPHADDQDPAHRRAGDGDFLTDPEMQEWREHEHDEERDRREHAVQEFERLLDHGVGVIALYCGQAREQRANQ